jgi:DNA replicative helicase MCM subunit Mcm2 (Cdc46/Mcm family)
MWIRSQKKNNLIDVHGFTIRCSPYVPENQYSICDCSEEGWVLGQYESEQRCIEILGEIQKWMCHGTEGYEERGDCKVLTYAIFQMPEK